MDSVLNPRTHSRASSLKWNAPMDETILLSVMLAGISMVPSLLGIEKGLLKWPNVIFYIPTFVVSMVFMSVWNLMSPSNLLTTSMGLAGGVLVTTIGCYVSRVLFEVFYLRKFSEGNSLGPSTSAMVVIFIFVGFMLLTYGPNKMIEKPKPAEPGQIETEKKEHKDNNVKVKPSAVALR